MDAAGCEELRGEERHSVIVLCLQDFSDAEDLLAPANVDHEALCRYARDAAFFSTGGKLPDLQFAQNHALQPDVAMFDFTCMRRADNASLVRERRGKKLLMGLVGDCLVEVLDMFFNIDDVASCNLCSFNFIARRSDTLKLHRLCATQQEDFMFSRFLNAPQTLLSQQLHILLLLFPLSVSRYLFAPGSAPLRRLVACFIQTCQFPFSQH